MCGRIIVHSPHALEEVRNLGVSNAVAIEYPSLHPRVRCSRGVLRRRHKLPAEKVILAALGSTRREKGLDVFLAALQILEEPVVRQLHVLIAGKAAHFREETIRRGLHDAGVGYTLRLRHLGDTEFIEYLALSDGVVLPYTREFKRASGPLVEAVANEVPVIGPSHGNLGAVITEHRLGYTFSAGDACSLANVIGEMVKHGWSSSEASRDYRSRTEVEHFLTEHKRIYDEVLCG